MTRRLAILCALLAAAPAVADEVKKRELPDYDGRGPEATTAGDVALWVPRVVVSPLYLTSEFLLRRPLRWLVITGERNRWPARIFELFTTQDAKAGIVPTFYVDLGFSPAAGVYLFVDDFVAEGNDLRFNAGIGRTYRSVTLADRVRLGAFRLSVRGSASERDDNVFYGTGPRAADADLQRYGMRRLETGIGLEGTWGPLRASASLGLRDLSFGSFAEPYGGPVEGLGLSLDTRRRTGVRLSVDLEHGPKWIRYGGAAAASVDVDGRGRVLTATVTAAMADPLDGDLVPFTELCGLGGSGPLRGFVSGRLIGRSSAAALLTWEWPIWVWLAGVVHVGAGNVFDEHLDGFDVDLFRMSTGFGMRSMGAGDHRFEVLIALGTETFADGASVDSVRFFLGGTHAF